MKQETKRTLTPKLRFTDFRDSGNWNAQKLGNVATIIKGRGVSKAELAPDGKQPCIRYGELYTHYGEVIENVVGRTNANADDLVLSKKQDVIIPSSGETKIDIATASCVMLDNIALGGDLNVLRSDLYGPFFSYYLNGPKRFDIAKVAQGDTVAHLYPSQLEKVEIAYPSPLEQQKIADCLGSLDALIAAEGWKLAALRDHKRGLMQRLFPQSGQTHPRLRFPEFRDLKNLRTTTLGEVVRFQSGGTPSKSNSVFWNGSIPWVSARSMKHVLLEDAENHITNAALEDGAKLVPAGTVLMLTRGMTLLRDVPVCMTQCSMAFNQDVKALLTNDAIYDSFLLYLMIGNKHRLLKMVDIAGHGTGRLNTDELKSIDIKLPELAEQQRIADCLSSLDTLITAQAATIEALKQHKHGLMQQLFPAPEGQE